jgi:hypothetical protein
MTPIVLRWGPNNPNPHFEEYTYIHTYIYASILPPPSSVRIFIRAMIIKRLRLNRLRMMQEGLCSNFLLKELPDIPKSYDA